MVDNEENCHRNISSRQEMLICEHVLLVSWCLKLHHVSLKHKIAILQYATKAISRTCTSSIKKVVIVSY